MNIIQPIITGVISATAFAFILNYLKKNNEAKIFKPNSLNLIELSFGILEEYNSIIANFEKHITRGKYELSKTSDETLVRLSRVLNPSKDVVFTFESSTEYFNILSLYIDSQTSKALVNNLLKNEVELKQVHNRFIINIKSLIKHEIYTEGIEVLDYYKTPDTSKCMSFQLVNIYNSLRAVIPLVENRVAILCKIINYDLNFDDIVKYCIYESALPISYDNLKLRINDKFDYYFEDNNLGMKLEELIDSKQIRKTDQGYTKSGFSFSYIRTKRYKIGSL